MTAGQVEEVRERASSVGMERASASSNLLIIYLPCLQGELEPPEPMQAGDLDECFFPFASEPVSTGPESLLCEMGAIPFNPVQSWLKHESSQGESQ